MDETIGINLELPKDFSIKLDRHLIDLKEKGCKKTKADLIIELARMALNHETNGKKT
jgi:hypothetical protein